MESISINLEEEKAVPQIVVEPLAGHDDESVYNKVIEILNAYAPEGGEIELSLFGQTLTNSGVTKRHLNISKMSNLPQYVRGGVYLINGKAGEATVIKYVPSEVPPYSPGLIKHVKKVPIAPAKVIGQDRTTGDYRLETPYGDKFQIKEMVVDRFVGKKLEKGDIVWCKNTTGSASNKFFWQIMPKGEDTRSYIKDSQTIKEYFDVGDDIYGIVAKKTSQSVEIALSPSFTRRVSLNSAENAKLFESLIAGTIYSFEITELSESNGKVIIKLKPKYNATVSSPFERIFSDLPAELNYENFMIPQSTLDYMKEDTRGIYDALEAEIGSINNSSLLSFINNCYMKELEEHTILCAVRGISKGTKEVRLDVDLGIKTEVGTPIFAHINKKSNRDKFYLAMVGAGNAGQEMERHVYVPDWDTALNELSTLALEENWEYKNSSDSKKPILKGYLKFTFYKAKLDGLILVVNNNAVFNTGLVDKLYDDIYCWLIPNNDINDPLNRKWKIRSFACVGRRGEGKELNKIFSNEMLPHAPTYINMECLDELFFDVRKGDALVRGCDYEHMIIDNIERFPRTFIRKTLSEDDELRAMIDSDTSARKIREYVGASEMLQRKLQQALKAAVEVAVKQCRWNYKTAVPVYYPQKNSISLLLPLNLEEDNVPSVALVIDKLPSGNYQGETILTLDMAYMDARQICRPNSEWLTPERIVNTEEIEKEPQK